MKMTPRPGEIIVSRSDVREYAQKYRELLSFESAAGGRVVIDASELYALSRDLGSTGAKSGVAMYGVFKEGGKDLESTWKRRARETAGEHGKHYPDAITTDMRVSANIEVEVGPDSSRPQGGMSFDAGSVNQPPHLDAQFAADEVVPRIDRRIDAALAHLGL